MGVQQQGTGCWAKTNIGFIMSLTSPIVKKELLNAAYISQHDLEWFPVNDDEEKRMSCTKTSINHDVIYILSLLKGF